jgi:hypothetical protein
MNTHLFNAYTQLLLDLERSGDVRPNTDLAYNLHVVHRRTLMQWGSQNSRYLLLITREWSLLTRLNCSTRMAELARETLSWAMEERSVLRLYFIEGQRMRAVDGTRAIELLEAPSPYEPTSTGPTTGVLRWHDAPFATWLVRPLRMHEPADERVPNLGPAGIFAKLSAHRLKRLKGRNAIPPRLLEVDRVSCLAIEGAPEFAQIASAPAECVVITLLPSALQMIKGNPAMRLDVIADMDGLAADMIGSRTGQPRARVRVQIDDATIDELLALVNSQGCTWEAMAKAFPLPAGLAPSLAAEIATRLQDVSSLSEEEWANICVQVCPGSPQAPAPEQAVDREVQR